MIAANDAALAANKINCKTDGTVTQTDIQNQANYQANYQANTLRAGVRQKVSAFGGSRGLLELTSADKQNKMQC